jgi:hypothetical protein
VDAHDSVQLRRQIVARDHLQEDMEAMPQLPLPRDELLHEPTGDPALPWKDTWYFSVFDERAGVHLCMHMTVSANRAPDTRVIVSARRPGGELVVLRREDGTHSDTAIGNTLARLELVNLSWDSEHELRWICDGDQFGFDLVVRGVHFAPDFTALFPGVYPTGAQGHSYAHTEQVVRASGTLRWEGEPDRAVSAFGWRDRGWGRRKSEMTFGAGYDLIGGILPGGEAFAFTAMRNVEHGPDAPLPAYGYLSDAASVTTAVGGIYYKDSMSFPLELDLEFADGRRATGTQVRRASTLGTAFHEAEPEVSGIAVGARDYYAVLADPEGREFCVFSNEGHTLLANVTRGSKFF